MKFFSNSTAKSFTFFAVFNTFACDNGPFAVPAAGLVMQAGPATFKPHRRAAMVSGTVLVPTASAPRRAKAQISAAFRTSAR